MLATFLKASVTAVPVSSATVTYIGGTNNTSTSNTYTFTNASIGGPGLIVLACQAEGDNSEDVSLSSVTVGGSSATIHTNQAARSFVGIASFRVASGTTATVVVNYTAGTTPSRMRLSVYRIQDNVSDTPVQTLTNYSASSRTSASLAFNSANDAVGVFGATHEQGSGTFTWTNATERFDTIVSSGTAFTGATRDLSTATVTVTATVSASRIVGLSGALWR